MQTHLIYMTFADAAEARRVGEHLVRSRLVACVNILDQMNAMYIWQDRFQDDRETVMIAKTIQEKVPEVIQTVREMHSYTCPCIVCLPIQDGHPDFLAWIGDQVTGPRGPAQEKD